MLLLIEVEMKEHVIDIKAVKGLEMKICEMKLMRAWIERKIIKKELGNQE